jgi:hypothetical protein
MDTGLGDVANPSMRDSILDALTTYGDLCKHALHPYSCGFKQDPSNANLLSKKIRAPDGTVKTVQIKLIDATLDAHAEADFLASFSDDAVFYLGHSRSGGGPDFNPPRLLANGDRDYAWYRRNQPGFRAIETTLANSKDHPKLLALLSCDSGKHFSERLHQLAPETALIVSQAEVEFLEQEHSLIGAIDGLLGAKCHDDFVKDLQFVDLSSGKDPAGILQLIGFFE